ncbi:MAG: glycosyl hydrolase family 18 protein [Sarcina sp.]
MKRKKLYESIAFMSACLVAAGIFGTSASAQDIKGKMSNKEITEISQKQSVKRNVMYYGDWSIWGGEDNFYPKDIPADQLTHLNYAFMDFDANGELKFTDKDAALDANVGMNGVTWGDENSGLLNAFQNLRAENPNLKLGISLGGWSKSGDFSEVAASKEKRTNLINNTLAFIRYTNMDFVDIDWEYPGLVRDPDTVDNQNDEGTTKSRPEDKENYIILLEEFRAALDKQGAELGKTYELSVALPCSVEKVDMGIDVDKLFNAVDFANIMTYDMRGAWDKQSGHQTPLYTNPNDPHKGKGLSVDESVNYFISKGAEPEKIVVGAAYYTRGWEKVSDNGGDKNNPGLFGEAAVVNKDADLRPTPGALNEAPAKVGDGGRMGGVWSYRSHDELKTKYPNLKEYWDDSAKAPYLYDPNGGAFFTYDNVRSIEEKANYVNQNELGGMIAWMASQDKPTSGTTRDELTKATKNALFGAGDLVEHEIVYDKLDLTVTIKPYKEEWGTGQGYDITIKNNELPNEKGDVLKGVERGAETIKNGKLYIKTNGNKVIGGDHTAGKVTQEGEYSVVDLSTNYEGKLVKQGSSYKMRLTTEKEPTDLSGIESIHLTQRVMQEGAEIGKQLLYGEEGEAVNKAPTLSGVNDITVIKGESFDDRKGVSAIDKEDGDLTSKIEITGKVDTSKVGEYNLTYSVSDKEGLKAEKVRKVTVIEKPIVENSKPVITGADNVKIEKGSEFDKAAGVKASDKEDGDLTSKIVITGNVDTSKVGDYKVTYTVADKEGLEASVERTVTVVEKETPPPIGDTYDPNKVYNAGDKVTYKGKEYTAKWWVKGEAPDKSAAWEVTPETGEDGTQIYVPGKAYNGGDVVSYNGAKYKAKWWTNTVPGNDESWSKI